MLYRLHLLSVVAVGLRSKPLVWWWRRRAGARGACRLASQVGGLIKRLDTGDGSYAKELEEDYEVAEQLDQASRVWIIFGTAGLINQSVA